jgi:hypothetical protein
MSLLDLPASIMGEIIPHLGSLADLHFLSLTHSQLRDTCLSVPPRTLITLGLGTLKQESGRSDLCPALTDEKTMLLLLKIYYKKQITNWLSKHGDNEEDFHRISLRGTEEMLRFLERTFASNLNLREMVQILRSVTGLEPRWCKAVVENVSRPLTLFDADGRGWKVADRVPMWKTTGAPKAELEVCVCRG